MLIVGRTTKRYYAQTHGQRAPGQGQGRRPPSPDGPRGAGGRAAELASMRAEALTKALRKLIDDDRYPLSPRVMRLKEILAKFRPEPKREPPPPLRNYEPPRMGRYRKRR